MPIHLETLYNLQKKEFYEHRCMAVSILVVFVVPVYGIGVFFGFGGYINTSVLSAFEQELCLMSSSDQL